MWVLLKSLIVKWALLRYALGSLGGLLALAPIAWLLKVIGIPLLIILGIIAIPLLILLAAVGLPIAAVLAIGAMILALLGMLLSVGMVVVKILVFVVLPILAVWLVFRWVMDSGRPRGGEAT